MPILITASAGSVSPDPVGCRRASVVMYDATGVRMETGKQAVLLNKILEDNPFNWKPEEFQMKLKEYVGHTPLQVLMGAILGIATAFWMRGFYW